MDHAQCFPLCLECVLMNWALCLTAVDLIVIKNK